MIGKIFSLFQSDVLTFPWLTFLGVVSPILVILLSVLLYRSKNRADVTKTLADADKARAEIGKTELDKMVAVMDRAPSWFAQIETMHAKNLDNETKIENQERDISKLNVKCEVLSEELDKCREGELSCKETKTNVKLFLSDVEAFVKQYPESDALIVELHSWLRKLGA